jgi:hypothetical protein
MCSQASCRSCGKPTWRGCGLHVTSALRGVKEKDRCPTWKKGYSYPCGDVKDNEFSFMKFFGMGDKK